MTARLNVVNQWPGVVNMINGKGKQFTTAACAAVLSNSRMFAPVAYGRLVNSQRSTVGYKFFKIEGIVGYDTEYAAYLEGTPENPAVWSPKRPKKYGNIRRGIPKATAWNPNAEPGFLRKGAEAAMPEIEVLKQVFRV